MSAQPVAPARRPRARPGPRRLRLVLPGRGARLARVPFLMVLVGLVGIGMVGLLLLNTSLQRQAIEASELRRLAAETSYTEGELEQLLTETGSTRELTRRATELGMRPNREIAFVSLPDGRITGKAGAADGLYLPSSLTKKPEEVARERSDRALKRAAERRAQETEIGKRHSERILAARAKEAADRQQAAAGSAPPTPAPPASGGR